MKVILLSDVKKVGKKNEIVEVSQGYFNNVLAKKNLAVEADKNNLEKLEKLKENMQNEYDNDVKVATKLKEKLEKTNFEFFLKSNNGAVFGTISHKQVVERFKEYGFIIDKKMVVSEPINHLGDEVVELKLHKEVTAKVNVVVKDKK